MSALGAKKIRFKRALVSADEILTDGLIEIRDGKIEAISTDPGAPGDGALEVDTITPAFVNAHAHLDLSALIARLEPGSEFTAWIKNLIKERASIGEGFTRGQVELAIDRMIRSGALAVGDIVSGGESISREPLQARRLKGRLYHEIIDPDPSGADWTLQASASSIVQSIERGANRSGLRVGLSPHAIYSTSLRLLELIARDGRLMRAPIAIHACETEAEDLFAMSASGPLARLIRDELKSTRELERYGAYPIKILERVGLLDRARLALIHLNHPREGDIDLIAGRSCSVVWCPGSNIWFGRSTHPPVQELLSRSVPVALGTDSLASNEALDIRREARLAKSIYPDLSWREIFQMATIFGARALGIDDQVGSLAPQRSFDALEFKLGVELGPNDIFERIFSESVTIESVFIDGERLFF